jgi:hypothetical protein
MANPVMRSKEKLNRSEQPKSEEGIPNHGKSQTTGHPRDWQYSSKSRPHETLLSVPSHAL